jgi:hypothetical protein
MLMVIFGAGASYDSAEAFAPGLAGRENLCPSDDRPPLANELFDNRREFALTTARFKECQSIVTFLRNRDEGISLEATLEQLQSKSTSHAQGYREMVAVRYYLQWIIRECELRWSSHHHGVTNYKALLYLIRQSWGGRGPIVFVTFNYDTMLEEALPTLGMKNISRISDYIDSNHCKLIKIHGSTNWGRVIRGAPLEDFIRSAPELIAQQVIRYADLIVENCMTREYEMIADPESRTPNTSPLFPAIAIPVESKLDFECPSEHIQELKKHLPQISQLLVIGWRAADPPFLELLYKAPSNIPVQVVTASTDGCLEVINNMERAGLGANHYTHSNLGFTRYVTGRDVQKFLSK